LGLYQNVQAELAQNPEDKLKERLSKRAETTFQSVKNSEIDQTPSRPLHEYEQNGFTIHLTPEGVETIKQLYQQNSGIPLLEQVNRLKVFRNSSISPSIAAWIITHHDILDHGLYPALARREGIIGRYTDLMKRVGNPLDTDMLSYKGEILSTIMYGWRESHFDYAQHPLEHTTAEMITILSKNLSSGKNVTINQLQALKLLQGIDPQSTEAMRISSIWNQELYTFDYHMRRKVGPIYELDPENQYQPVGLFDFRDPEFVAFIAESAHMICQYEDFLKATSLNISFATEKYLVDIARGEKSPDEPLVLTLAQVVSPANPDSIDLPQETQDWFRNNPWHSVDYTIRKAQKTEVS
jgi:hypothetical protein